MAKKQSFLNPTKLTLALFVLFLVFIFIVVGYTQVKIFPCKIRGNSAPTALNTMPYNQEMCGLQGGTWRPIGVEIIYSGFSYLIGLVIFLVVPYLLACWINQKIKKK